MSCTDCGTADVELSTLGRCLQCIRAASDVHETQVDAENASRRREQAKGRRCVDLFGTGRWAHGRPHTPGCAQHVAPPTPIGAPPERERAGSPTNRLWGLVQAVANAGEGQRNHMLNWAAYKAAELVVTGQMDRAVVVDCLTEAGLAAGLSAGEIGDGQSRGTVASGLRSGGA